MFPLTEARSGGGGSGGMTKDGFREWEDLAAEDRVAGCPGYVSQKLSLHQIFLWLHFLTCGLTLESQIHVSCKTMRRRRCTLHDHDLNTLFELTGDLEKSSSKSGNDENASVCPLNSSSSKTRHVI